MTLQLPTAIFCSSTTICSEANAFTVHDDMKLQIIQLLGAYVPDDFNWDDHIGLFVY